MPRNPVACAVCQDKYPPYHARHLCPGCWRLYGGRTTKDRRPWVNRLINDHQREYARLMRHGNSTISLDELIDAGSIEVETALPVFGSSKYRKEKITRVVHRIKSH